jgi:dGTPase
MDVADDIAYSTYDLEDNFKAGFLQPLDLFTLEDEVVEKIVATIQRRIEESFPELSRTQRSFTTDDLLMFLFEAYFVVFHSKLIEIVPSVVFSVGHLMWV